MERRVGFAEFRFDTPSRPGGTAESVIGFRFFIDFTEWIIIVRKAFFKNFGCSKVGSEEE
jgi:hypothetical protein